jgi:hypothetical protein
VRLQDVDAWLYAGTTISCIVLVTKIDVQYSPVIVLLNKATSVQSIQG